MKFLTVLSHQMSVDCILNEESISRATLAIKIFKNNNYKLLITNGWAYRADCQIPISDVFANFIRSNSNIDNNKIVSNINSRDTVGDAFFLRQQLNDYECSELVIVTSDYHVKRTRIIFEKIFSGISNVLVIGSETKKINKSNVDQCERESIKAFEKTFNDADFNDIKSIYSVLSKKHPFYNGDIYPKLELKLK